MKSIFSKKFKKEPYFIAELNTSHFGDMKLAKKMILEAKKSGCHCVKLQSWTPDSLYSDNFFKKNPISKRFFEKYALSENQLKLLANFSRNNGIDFSSTPYTFREVDFLVKNCNPAFIKIASMDLNNYPFLKYISKKRKPIILSTGMGTLDEIKKAVKIIKKNGNNKITILHCISLYPAPSKHINLKNIITLKKEFTNLNVGYSDHTEGVEFAIAAISMGASVIEKHFTLDKKIIGMDNHMALEPFEMKTLTDSCNNIFLGLGSLNISLSRDEILQKKKMRRSIFFNKNLKKNKIVKLEDLDFKRPGIGVSIDNYNKFVGKKLKKNVESGKLLKKNYFI